jgi:subtilase family serine protease
MPLVLSFLPMMSTVAQAASSRSTSSPFSFTFKGNHYTLVRTAQPPPTDAQCRAQIGQPCYSPQEIRTAYDLDPVLKAGYTGKGQTIVIIDSFGDPTIQNDLQVFDSAYGLPAPPSFSVLAPLGQLQFDPNTPGMIGWAAEISLDVEWAHAMAPDANIVLMTSPVNETQGVQGMPEFLYLEQYAVNHHLGKIISQSWATTENTLFTIPGGRQVINNFDRFYQKADAAGVTVLGSTGDSGTANPDINGNIYPFPTVNFPASSPYITAVGGTSLFADTNGNYQNETAWSATGGGISQYFNEPNYQKTTLPASAQKLLNGHRGLPDIAFNADPGTGVLVYLSFPGVPAGWYIFGGTSEGSPTWAGIIADGNQMAGHSLGFINPAVYKLGKGSDYAESFHDITVGNNRQDNIPGYDATPSWDPTTGWGTPKVATFLEELIEQSEGQST